MREMRAAAALINFIKTLNRNALRGKLPKGSTGQNNDYAKAMGLSASVQLILIIRILSQVLAYQTRY